MANETRAERRAREKAEKEQNASQQNIGTTETQTSGDSTPMDTSINSDSDTQQNTSTTQPVGDRPIVDILVPGPNVPSPLVKRFSAEQREEIGRLFYGPTPDNPDTWGAGHPDPDIIRTRKEVLITKETSKTAQDEVWPYWGYIGVTEAGRVALTGSGKSGIAGKRVITEANPNGEWQFEWRASDGSDRKPKGESELNEKAELEAWGVGDFFEYGFDLDIRQPIRAMLNEAIKGDVQKLAQQVRAMVRIKAAKTHQTAFKMLVMQREEEGEILPAHITYASLGITADEEAATGVKR